MRYAVRRLLILPLMLVLAVVVFQVLSWYLGMLMRTAERMIAFRLTLECPRGESIAPDRPVIVLSRHAGPGASLVLIRVLLRDRGRVPKIVLKEKLRLDPAECAAAASGRHLLGAPGSARGRAGGLHAHRP
jgi:hypothetical protein